ncbi:hypothetical protein ACIHFB_09485 [Streptomyces sp. NPDC051963]|uniref:hypothetical protein n=1 Tax=Streptomyces sp. NPDC051963 TaxID=3365678 RepID=UPI0037CED0BA
MRSLLAAVLSLFLPARGAHRATGRPPSLSSNPPIPAHQPARTARRTRAYPADIVLADGLPLVRPYLGVWERERDEQDHRRLQRDRRRAAVLATLGQDYIPAEVA